MTAKQIITKTAVNIGRLLVAVTFIFSGFVKGMDLLGTQYKITDYLEALHIDWMFPDWSTLVMSVLLATAEFAIGIFHLFLCPDMAGSLEQHEKTVLHSTLLFPAVSSRDSLHGNRSSVDLSV